MYEKNDKRRVYWLIDLYLAGKIDDKTFCDEFYYSYGLEMDYGMVLAGSMYFMDYIITL